MRCGDSQTSRGNVERVDLDPAKLSSGRRSLSTIEMTNSLSVVDYNRMLTQYILKQLARARYKLLEDGTYFGEIPRLQGVWASGASLEACREELREVLESWLLLKLRSKDTISGLPLPVKRQRSARQYA